MPKPGKLAKMKRDLREREAKTKGKENELPKVVPAKRKRRVAIVAELTSSEEESDDDLAAAIQPPDLPLVRNTDSKKEKDEDLRYLAKLQPETEREASFREAPFYR